MDEPSSGIFSFTNQNSGQRVAVVPKALAIAASTVIILAGIKIASGLVGPMLLALFIAVILLVPLRWLQTRGCPNFLAYPIVLLCTVALFVVVTFFVGQSFNDFIRKIPAYRNQFVEKYADLQRQVEQQVERLGFTIVASPGPAEEEQNGTRNGLQNGMPRDEPNWAPPFVPEPEIPLVSEDSELEQILAELTSPFLEETDPIEEIVDLVIGTEKGPLQFPLDRATATTWITGAMHYIQSMLAGSFLVLLFTIFMLFEAAHFPRKVNRAFGADSPINFGHFHHIAEEIRRYLFLKTLSNLMSASAAMVVYYMFGVEGVLFWGILAFFMYYIPNLGGTLAAILPGLLIFVAADIYTVLLYIMCLLTVECAIAYGIEPKLLGHGLRLSTLVIILSLFFWGFLLGPIGLFLAAPLTVMIKIILQAFPETRWISVFLAGGREKD